ncbi:lipid A export permease/ATP-binding protein MsbA [Nitrospira moscoviensis]|uniref:Lipid A export ATP-binding/permease protein MsbA n=1 Tax=Nitrospira moscoviensis TaxID=42253 RepID=A0A0K2GGG4_NITMO|nr:lipid A export permease/ATP-binding protein MsbA [Nitrospira moscoviensis]ALA59924.1 Lipid A export ATP-binding/permease protein MsbA [Nitrospira moscoviensis]
MSNVDRFARLVRYLRPHKVRLIAAFVCSGLVAAFSAAYAWLVKPVLDEIFINKNDTLLLVLPLALFAVAVCKSAFNYGQNYLMNYVGNQVIADVRQALFAKLLRLPVNYHDRNTSGRLVSRVVNDVTLMANAVAGVLKDIFQQGLTFLAMLGVIFYQNWQLATLSIVVIPMAAVTTVRMGKRLRILATRGQERMGDMASTLQEALAGIRMVKAYGREDQETERFRRSNKAFLDTTMKAIQVSSLGSSHMEVIGVVGVAAIVWYGGFLVINGTMTPGAFFSFLTAMFMAYTPIRKLSGANNTIQQALAAAERVYEVLDLETEQERDRGTVVLAGHSHTVEFQQVSLRYESQAIHAVAGIDLSVKAGEVVALVGSSGSGKSTLVSLLPRFYEPTEGRILLDGLPLTAYTLQSLRAHIGIVSQDVVLFDDTIRNNIAFGRTGAMDVEIQQAAALAYAHDFIQRLPQGYDTIIGERGLKLSGGERQRLAIARAILRDPPILILDEATSALDTESERVVQLALANLMKNRTTLVIAHRLSTIQNADRIVVLSHGTIAEIGSHEELLRRGGLYKRLHAMQFQDVPSA